MLLLTVPIHSTRSPALIPSRIFVSLLTAAMLTACGGGGGGGESGSPGGTGTPPQSTDNIPTTTSLPVLNGLAGDADQNYRLFYVDASHTHGGASLSPLAEPWLMAYDPQTESTVVLDKKLSNTASSSNPLFPLALHKASVDTSSGEITDFQIQSVAYYQDDALTFGTTTTYSPSSLMKVNVAAGGTPTRVSNETGSSADNGSLPTRQIVAFDLANADAAKYAFPGDASSSIGTTQYRMIDMDAGPGTPVDDFGDDIVVQVGLHYAKGASAGEPYGWLVVDKNQDDCLALVLDDLTDATCIPNAVDGGQVKLEQSGDDLFDYITGAYPLKQGMVIALPVVDRTGSSPLSVTSRLWFYQYENPASGPKTGKLYQLKNNNDESLQTTALGMFGPGEAGRTVSKGGDTLFIATGEGGAGGILAGGSTTEPDIQDLEVHTYLLKITTEAGSIGWEQIYHQGGKIAEGKGAQLGDFLIDNGSQLLWEINETLQTISLDGQTSTVLDGRESSGSSLLKGAFDTPTGSVSPAGWFFYNREYNQSDYAVAAKTDGSKRVELKDCRWIGASTKGHAKFVGGNVAHLEPSEVFMACDSKTIAAVSANDPEAGRVILGSLSKQAETIVMGQAAPGPHRLIRVSYEDGNEEKPEVVYVNTREKGTLKFLMDNPADKDVAGSGHFLTAPVSGF